MQKELLRAAWVEVDLRALRFNIRNIRRKVGEDRKIYGVIKADAYGHGVLPVARTLQEEGIHAFAVATLEEAIELREAGIEDEILILGLTPSPFASVLIDYDLAAVVNDAENARAIAQAAAAAGKTARVLIALDSGMGRIGYLPEVDGAINREAIQDIQKIAALCRLDHSTAGASAVGALAADTSGEDASASSASGTNASAPLEILGLFSHFATADAADKSFAREQERRYLAFARALEDAGVALPMKTFANSASIMEIPSVHLDAVRPGIILYGLYPSDEVDPAQLALRPVMSVKAKILKVKTVPVGASCGYGRKFIAQRESVIATIGVGYADGYPRPYSSVAEVLVHGRRAPIAGNICMDQCMIDVTDVPGVAEGDEVILMGRDPESGEAITEEDIARATGTINYEIVCAFGQRLPKVYLDE